MSRQKNTAIEILDELMALIPPSPIENATAIFKLYLELKDEIEDMEFLVWQERS